MTRGKRAAIIAATGMILPKLSMAQGMATQMNSLHAVLDQLYDEMMPLCSHLISVGQGIAGFAAVWYIGSRIWRHIANAEPIDFYPLFRPFVLGFCIMVFPSVLALMNGVIKPTVTATGSMVTGSNKAIELLLKQKELAMTKTNAYQMYVGNSGNGDRDRWYKYLNENADASGEGILESIGNDVRFAMSKASYNFRNSVKEMISEVLGILFEAAALCINTLRTFQLIVLAILGPLVFGIAVFDGFQHTLTVWIARYINISLWLPIANIFGSIIGKVQEKMLELDISQVNSYGDTFFSSTDMAYMVFMIIGIVGYSTVPSVANYIVHAGGGSALAHKTTSLFNSSSQRVINTTTAGAGMAIDSMGSSAGRASQNMAGYFSTSSYFKDKQDPSSGLMGDRLKGNS
jgi:conjugative transposon TraJ protein